MKLLIVFLWGLALFSLSKGWWSRRRRRRHCPVVNCSWKPSKCSKTCGEGQIIYIKTRGNQCGGSCRQPPNRICRIKNCAVNCAVLNWGHWGPCKDACNKVGFKERTRNISVAALYGGIPCSSRTETKKCIDRKCGCGKNDCVVKYGKCRNGVKTGRIVKPQMCGGKCPSTTKKCSRKNYWAIFNWLHRRFSG